MKTLTKTYSTHESKEAAMAYLNSKEYNIDCMIDTHQAWSAGEHKCLSPKVLGFIMWNWKLPRKI